MQSVSLQGHRGARGLLAENTLPSLLKPFEYNMHGIEFDVQISRDHQVVIYHDLQLKPSITRNAQGKWLQHYGPAIYSLSLNELQQYKLGRINKKTPYGFRFIKQKTLPDQRIPTLAELIEALDKQNLNQALLNIEIKHSPLMAEICPAPELLAEKIVDEIHRLELAKRCIVQCFNWQVIKAVKQYDSSLLISCLTTIDPTEDTVSPHQGKPSLWNAGLDIRDFNHQTADMVAEFGAQYWAPYYQNLTKPALERAHQQGLKVTTWTVNHKASMRRLLNWGIDGIISDYPDKLAAVSSE